MSLEVLRTVAAAMTILAAAMVAANLNARITVCGFALFTAASVAWIADGILEPKSSLVIQNAVLLVIRLKAAQNFKHEATHCLPIRFSRVTHHQTLAVMPGWLHFRERRNSDCPP
jgi:hypothetical protein